MKYESSILKRLIDTYGVIGNPRYLSEIIKEFIVRGKELYPQLFTYQSDWLAHIDEFGLTPEYTVSYTGQHIYAPNTKEKPVKSAILKGSTKYRDIDTGEVLDTFDEGRNLELVSVKMPVLTTANEDGTKTNILSTPSDLELRGIGDVQDTLDCLTGEVTERIVEIVLDGVNYKTIKRVNNTDDTKRFDTNFTFEKFVGTNDWVGATTMNSSVICDKVICVNGQLEHPNRNAIASFNGIPVLFFEDKTILTVEKANEWLKQNPITVQYQLKTPTIKTVDLTIHDKDHQKVERLSSFEGGTHFTTSSQDGSLLPTLTVDVVTDLEKTMMVCSLEGNTM